MGYSLKTMSRTIITLCIAQFFFAGQGMASGMFPAANVLSENTVQRIAVFLSKHTSYNSSHLEITPTDLNNDMIDEYIVRDKQCASTQSFCDILILAQDDAEFLELGIFNARKIMPAPQYTNGVRDILVYNDLNNVFKHNVVKWNSSASTYSPERPVSSP